MHPTPNASELPEDPAALKEMIALRDELLDMVAHDLNSPLTTIMMAAETIRSEFSGSNADLDGLVNSIEASSDRLRRIISKFLIIKSLHQGVEFLNIEEISLLPTTSAVIRRLQPGAADRALELVLECSAKNDAVLADPDVLDQVIDLLISNAIKCTPADSCIRVELREENREVVLAVADRGPALSEEQASSLFRRSPHPGKKRGPGERPLGLGLAACKDLMALMGGRIEAKSAPEGGAIFELRFPTQPAFGG